MVHLFTRTASERIENSLHIIGMPFSVCLFLADLHVPVPGVRVLGCEVLSITWYIAALIHAW